MVVAGVVSERGGDVGVAGQAEQPDHGVAQGGHDVWPAAGSVLGVVFGEGDVSRTQCNLFSMAQCPRSQPAIWAGAASVTDIEVTA